MYIVCFITRVLGCVSTCTLGAPMAIYEKKKDSLCLWSACAHLWFINMEMLTEYSFYRWPVSLCMVCKSLVICRLNAEWKYFVAIYIYIYIYILYCRRSTDICVVFHKMHNWYYLKKTLKKIGRRERVLLCDNISGSVWVIMNLNKFKQW